EDGIRDFHVTGVQTCALPISDSVRPNAEDRGSEGTLAHKPFLSSVSGSVREGDDHLVADHFDPVYVQRELRGWILRLPGLKIPRAIAVLADNRDPLSVHVAVREHRPLVGARLVHAVETVSEAYDHDV